MNANEEMLASYAESMLVILMLILMLLNLNTGYADTDADLCIRSMSLCTPSDKKMDHIINYNFGDKMYRLASSSIRQSLHQMQQGSPFF